MRDKKAFLLNEMVLIVAIVSLLMLLSVKPVRMFLDHTGRVNRTFEQQLQIDAVLQRLGDDIENAVAAFEQPSDLRLDVPLLYLTGRNGVVCYQFADGELMRAEGQTTDTLKIPQMRIEWHLLPLQGDKTAVAVTAWQKREGRGATFAPIFKGSHLFVVNLNGTMENR